ncbi:MAG: transporter substrate-binding domain-containing protein [Pseudomonadota bacterium]
MATRRALGRLLLWAGLLAGQLAWAACSKPFTMVTEEWPPYSIGGKTQSGLDVELAQAIFREAGCTLYIGDAIPTVRRLLLFRQGKFDLMLAASNTPERRVFANFSSPYRYESVGLFALAANIEQFRDVDNFDKFVKGGHHLLVPKVGWYGPDYANHYNGLKASGRLAEFGTLAQGINMLRAKRAPLLMNDISAASYQARVENIEIRQLPFLVLHAPVHLMLSKASTTADDLVQINAAITRLERNGTLQTIRESYGIH